MKTSHRLHEASVPNLSPQVADLVALVRQDSVAMSERQRLGGLSALRSRILGSRHQRVARRTQLALAAVVGCGLLVIVVRRERAQTPLSFRVEGAVVGAGGYVQAEPATHPIVRFGDGSEVSLEGQTRLHVLASSEHGAHVTLDEGRAHVHVVHAQQTSWLVDAGPFAITVTGTAFAISWSEAAQLLDLRLESGCVTVRGPVEGAALSLHEGQWLTVRAKDVLIRSLAETDAVQKPMPVAPASAADESGVRAFGWEARAEAKEGSDHDVTRTNGLAPRRTRVASLASKETDHHWAAALAKGRFERIVDEALGMGVDAALSDSTSEDLAALGDAARYSRHHDIARSALLALRRRFPSSDHSRDAAFLLGRLCEADDDDRAALSWFESYLAEAPDGRFAPEALGRKMNLAQRHEGRDAARPLAAAYLRRFPDGAYAEAARALMRTP